MITLTGSGFGDGATVTFRGVAATGVVVHDQTRLDCTPPELDDGFANVVVTNLDGTTGELDDEFVYTTLSVTPEEGPTTGGTVLTLTINDGGAGIDWFPDDHELVVTVDPGTGTPLAYTRIDNGTLECVTAAQLCGPSDVIVTDLDLEDDLIPVFALPGGYTYELPPPMITDIYPASGPSVGGQVVVLTGSFSCATCSDEGTLKVAIGGVPLTAVVCSSTTIIGMTGVGALPVQRVGMNVTVAGFTLGMTPSEGSARPGGTSATAAVPITRAGVSTARTGDVTGPVTLSAARVDDEGHPIALPPGIQAAFSPNPASGDTSTLTLTAAGAVDVGTQVDVTVTGTAPRLPDQTTDYSLTVAGFTLSAPPDGSVTQGSTATIPVSITQWGDFTGDVTLTATGLRPGVTAAFDPNPATDESTLTVTAAATTRVGLAGTVTITGTASGAPTQTTTVSLTVDPADDDAVRRAPVATPPRLVTISTTPTVHTAVPPPGYSLSAASKLNVLSESSATSSIDIGRTGGFADPIALVAVGMPDGVTATFLTNPVTVDDPGTTITYEADPTALLGSAPVTIASSYTPEPSDVVVTNPDGQTDTLVGGYLYVNAPTVLGIDPDLGPDMGGTAVTISGADFQDGAAVALWGVWSHDGSSDMTIADAVDITVLDSTTILATTGAHPAGRCKVVVTNPDFQEGTLEDGYGYEGWWPGDIEPFEDLPGLPVWVYGSRPPFPGWPTEQLLVPPPDGWWMSTSAYGGDTMVVASSRPKDPRRWNQIAVFATGPAAMLGGSPGIAGNFHNRLIYAASDYVVGTTYPPIRIYDGSFDRELCRLPPTAAQTVPHAILSLLVANGTIYLSTFDSGTSSADWIGRVFSLEVNTALLSPVGTAALPTGHLPYALAWHNGMLWVGTHRQTTEGAAKILRLRPDLPAPAWVEDGTFAAGFNVAALYSWHGTLYAGMTSQAGTFAQIIKRGSAGTWSTANTGSGGTATHGNGFLAFCEFRDALYASYWNADTPAVATIRKTTDGTTWTTVFTGAGGTARPFIVLTVDKDELFAVGGGAHLTAAILRTTDGTTWTDLTAELPDADKTALPAVAALVF